MVKANGTKNIHPWDNLKPCHGCGNIPLLLGKDGLTFESGSPYFVRCRCIDCDCGTDAFQDWTDAVNHWNSMQETGKG